MQEEIISKPKTKMYFDEPSFQQMIADYQKSAVIINGVVVHKDEILERKIVDQVQKIVIAIINQYHYYYFEDIDDLRQEGLRACFSNFMKFHPSKGSAFNYFSIITKIHLLNYTDRRKKHRNLTDIDGCLEVECREEVNYDLFFENLETTLFRIIDENFVGDKRKKYVKIASIMTDYLRKSQKFVSKSDMYSWFRSLGFKSLEVREFIKDLGVHYEDIVAVAGD